LLHGTPDRFKPDSQHAEIDGEELLGFCLHVLLAMTGAFLLVQSLFRSFFVSFVWFFKELSAPFRAYIRAIRVPLKSIFAPSIRAVDNNNRVVWLGTALLWDFRGFGQSEFIAGHFWRYESNQLFTSKCVESECLEQWLVAVPAMGNCLVWHRGVDRFASE
jgi:hypothetical protein